jgi:hypothetical protein
VVSVEFLSWNGSISGFVIVQIEIVPLKLIYQQNDLMVTSPDHKYPFLAPQILNWVNCTGNPLLSNINQMKGFTDFQILTHQLMIGRII